MRSRLLGAPDTARAQSFLTVDWRQPLHAGGVASGLVAPGWKTRHSSWKDFVTFFSSRVCGHCVHAQFICVRVCHWMPPRLVQGSSLGAPTVVKRRVTICLLVLVYFVSYARKSCLSFLVFSFLSACFTKITGEIVIPHKRDSALFVAGTEVHFSQQTQQFIGNVFLHIF